LLLSAWLLNAQLDPAAQSAALAASTAAGGLYNTIMVADVGNCEVAEFQNATAQAYAVQTLTQNFLNGGATSSAADQILQLATDFSTNVLLNWPACWDAEAQRVLTSAIGVIQQEMQIVSNALNGQ
ncbi:hypothetical protein PMAYCL1PPCAC_15904, partial [Pristionchus mayeri]